MLGGGIGSGKSEVRRMLSLAGVLTVDADGVGHEVLEPDGPAFEAVVAQWPDIVVDGRIDRAALGEVVFADLSQLRRLEAITHPHIFGTIATRLEGIDGVVVVESPLIEPPIEGSWRMMVVDAVDDARVRRAMARGLGEAAVTAVMRAQPSRAEWLARADLVIPNHGLVGELQATVDRVVGVL